MHINHKRGETRAKAQNYRYSDAAMNRVNQDAANVARRRAGKREAAAQSEQGGEA